MNTDAICFGFDLKVHIGGFVFKKYEKAFEKLFMSDNDFIYGDSFTIKDNAIEHIGNNVIIGFNDMDFGESSAGSVEICLRCDRKNSFQIISTGDNKPISNMIEVETTPEYKTLCFDLDNKIKGKNTVSLVFLPGCDIDIESICFIKSI